MTLPPADRDPRPRLLIVGCSTRAAAWSAIRASFRPVCADQFGDEDLRQVAEVVETESLFDPGIKSSAPMSSDAWMFVGGMENQSGRLRELSDNAWRFGKSLATEPKHLATLRSPEFLQTAADAAGITPLEIRRDRRRKSHDRLWLLKQINSGGGLNIQFDIERESKPEGLLTGQYLQEFSDGRPMSVVFAVSKAATRILGITEQLIGCGPSGPPSQFAYCGSIAPASLTRSAAEQLRAVADSLSVAGLRGLCGIDFLWDGTSLRLVELNPRYTASCELLELALQRPLLTEHYRCFDFFEDASPASVVPKSLAVFAFPQENPAYFVRGSFISRRGLLFGKLILYARRAVIAPDLSRFVQPRSPWTVPLLADVPRIGTPFEPGQPLCTVFATGRHADTVRQKLYRRAARVRRWFGDES